MRRRNAPVNSTAESFRLASRAVSSSMVAKAKNSSSIYYSGGLHASLEAFSVKVEPAPDSGGLVAAATTHTRLENLFLPPQISKRSDVGNGQRDAKLILGAYWAKRQAAIFQSDPAAGTVIAYLHELILQ